MADMIGQHVVVTGAGSGAGEAIALAFALKGARVTALGRRLAPLEAVAAQSDRIFAISGDVTEPCQVWRRQSRRPWRKTVRRPL
jgi:3-hydroxybutyrate dehydrogenase